MLGYQPLEQGVLDLKIGYAGCDMRIQFLGFIRVAEIQDLVAVAGCNIGFVVHAAGRCQAQGKES